MVLVPIGGGILGLIGLLLLLEVSGVFPVMRAGVEAGTQAAESRVWNKREKILICLVLLLIASPFIYFVLFNLFT